MTRTKRGPGRLRIIGGEYRGRVLRFSTSANIRPTPDRVRETVFNWLAPGISDANCLDLYAGSGALGFEALSRGAASVSFVDNSSIACEGIRTHLHELAATERSEVVNADAKQFIKSSTKLFDIVFVDPPFSRDMVRETLVLLTSGDRLAADALVYVEHERGLELSIDDAFGSLREKHHGASTSRLLRFEDRDGH